MSDAETMPGGSPGQFRPKAIRIPPDVIPEVRILTHPPLDVVAGIIQRQDTYLIAQRLPKDRLPGVWEFPGGKVDAGEDLTSALQRELWEELGVKTAVGNLVLSTTHAYPDLDIRLHFFRATIVEGEPQPLESSALRWVTAAELFHYEFPPADRSLLELLAQNG